LAGPCRSRHGQSTHVAGGRTLSVGSRAGSGGSAGGGTASVPAARCTACSTRATSSRFSTTSAWDTFAPVAVRADSFRPCRAAHATNVNGSTVAADARVRASQRAQRPCCDRKHVHRLRDVCIAQIADAITAQLLTP
jgi:hypothetical protein